MSLLYPASSHFVLLGLGLTTFCGAGTLHLYITLCTLVSNAPVAIICLRRAPAPRLSSGPSVQFDMLRLRAIHLLVFGPL